METKLQKRLYYVLYGRSAPHSFVFIFGLLSAENLNGDFENVDTCVATICEIPVEIFFN